MVHTYVSPKEIVGSVPYDPVHIPIAHPIHVDGMVMRTSKRWFRSWPSKREVRNVPYVGASGKFSMFKLATWYCHPEQLVASLTSTVYQRLLKIWGKRKRKVKDIQRRDKLQLLQVAAMYTVTHSDYFLDRALALLTKRKPLRGLLVSFTRKLDDKFWFVYSQVCFQTYWLTFQSLGISDKSRIKEVYENFMSSDSLSHKHSSIVEAFETASDVTRLTKFRESPFVKVVNIRGPPKGILALFTTWSEPPSDSEES